MRPFRSTATRLTAVAFAFAFAATAAVAATEALVDDYMRKSGLWEQLAQVEPGIQQGITQNQRQARQLTDDQLARLRAACTAVYEPDRLRKAMRVQLIANLAEADAQEALAWFATDLGARVTKLEEASSRPAEYVRIEAIAAQSLAALSPARKAQVERLVSAAGVVETAASVAVNQQLGVMRGLASFAGRSDTAPTAEAKAQLERFRTQLPDAMRPRIIANAAVVYGDLSDKELAEYVAFLESPAGRRTSGVLGAALDKVLGDAAQELGRRLGDAIKASETKST